MLWTTWARKFSTSVSTATLPGGSVFLPLVRRHPRSSSSSSSCSRRSGFSSLSTTPAAVSGVIGGSPNVSHDRGRTWSSIAKGTRIHVNNDNSNSNSNNNSNSNSAQPFGCFCFEDWRRKKQQQHPSSSSWPRFIHSSSFSFSPSSSTSSSSFVQDDNTQSSSFSSSSSPPLQVLVIGSSGALGSTIAHYLRHELPNCQVVGADVVEQAEEVTTTSSPTLDGFVKLPKSKSKSGESSSSSSTATTSSSSSSYLYDLTYTLTEGVDAYLRSRRRIDGRTLNAIIVASGAWHADDDPTTNTHGAVSNAPPTTVSKPPPQQPLDSSLDTAGSAVTMADQQAALRAYVAHMEDMEHANVHPVLAAHFLATTHQSQYLHSAHALLIVVGAAAALQPTPGMLAYGLAKNAAHHVVRTLGTCTGLSLETSPRLRQAGRHARKHAPPLDTLSVIGLLPVMLDTPANRRPTMMMTTPTCDTKDKDKDKDDESSSWARPRDIAVQIGAWLLQPEIRPHSGALVKVYNRKVKIAAQGGNNHHNADGHNNGAVGVTQMINVPAFELVR